MKARFRNNKWLLILNSIALLLSFMFFYGYDLSTILFSESYILSDSISYLNSAKMLYQELRPHPVRPLGFAAIVGIPYLFSNTISSENMILFNLILNFLLWLMSTNLLFLILKRFISPRIAFIVSLLYLFSIGTIATIFFVLTEIHFSTYFLLMIYVVIKAPIKARIIIICSFLNFLLLIKPGLLYLTLLGNLGIILAYLTRRIPKKSRYYFIYLFTVALLVVQLFAMKSVYGNYTISYIDKDTWYYYIGAQLEAKDLTKEVYTVYKEREAYFAPIEWKERYRISSEDLKAKLFSKPRNFFEQLSKNVYENTTKSSNLLIHIQRLQKLDTKAPIPQLIKLSSTYNKVFFYLTICCFLISIWRYKILFSFSGVLLLLLFYQLLTSGISFWQGDRFSVVLYPMVLVLFVMQIGIIKSKSNTIPLF